MSGNSAGSISQTITDLIIGQSYRLAFYMAGNPDGGPTVKTLNASIDGASGDFTFDTTGKSTTNMGYVRKFLDFTATSTSALLSFTSKDAGAYGAALDNVSISEIPVPASAPLLLAGLGGLAMCAAAVAAERSELHCKGGPRAALLLWNPCARFASRGG